MIEVDITTDDVKYESLFDPNLCKTIIEQTYDTLLSKNSLNIKGKCDNVLVSILITDDERIKDLNKEYRNIDAPTDVLSFAFEDEKCDENVDFPLRNLGEIVISYPCTLRNAVEFNEEPQKEAKRLLVHGLLHLLGYNHTTNNFKSESMLILQEELLNNI